MASEKDNRWHLTLHPSVSKFLGTVNAFLTDEGVPQDYSSKGAPAKRTGDKSLAPVKPRG